MSTWHFYRLADGALTGRSMSGPAADVAANCGPEEGVVTGVSDWRLQRVDLATGRLLDLPPPPVDRAVLSADVRAERDRRMAAADWVTLRAVRTQTPIPQPWADYLQALADVPQQPGFPDSINWPQAPSP